MECIHRILKHTEKMQSTTHKHYRSETKYLSNVLFNSHVIHRNINNLHRRKMSSNAIHGGKYY